MDKTAGGMWAKAAMQDARFDATILNPRDRQVTFISLYISMEVHSAHNSLTGSHDGTRVRSQS